MQLAVGSAKLPAHLHYELNDVACLFKRIIISLPGGLFGSPALYKAMAEIQARFDEKPGPSRMIDQARLIASAIDTIDAPYRKPLVIGFLGLVSIIGHETEETDEPERMNYRSLARVLAPILLGLSPADFQDSERDGTNPQLAAKSTDSKITLPPAMDKSKDLYKNAIVVLEMLITSWQKVVEQLRLIEINRLRVSHRATSRVTSAESGCSGRLPGVQENPRLEDESKGAQEDQVSNMTGSRAVLHKSDNTGKQRVRSSSERTLDSQSAVSSLSGRIIDPSMPEEGHQQQHLIHPFVDETEEEIKQNINNLLPSTPKRLKPSDPAPENLGAASPSTPRSNPASRQPSSRSGSYSQQLLQEKSRTASASSRSVGREAHSRRDQVFDNDITDGALDLDQTPPARTWIRASSLPWTATDEQGLLNQEFEAVRGGSPKGKNAFEAHQYKAYPSSSPRQVQDTPAAWYKTATEDGSKTGYHQSSYKQEHLLSASTKADRPEAFEPIFPSRSNSVRELAQQFEAVQRQGSELVAKDVVLSATDRVLAVETPGTRSLISNTGQIRSPNDSSSSAIKSQIPKPVAGHGRASTGESSSPSPVKTGKSRPSDASSNTNAASKSWSTPTNAQPTQAPAASALPRIREGSTRASPLLQPPSRPAPTPPVQRNMRSLSNYTTPSLEQMRSRNQECVPAASSLSLVESSSSLRSELTSSSDRTARPGGSPTPLSRRPVRVLSHLAPASTTTAHTLPPLAPARIPATHISHSHLSTPAQRPANDAPRLRRGPEPLLNPSTRASVIILGSPSTSRTESQALRSSLTRFPTVD